MVSREYNLENIYYYLHNSDQGLADSTSNPTLYEHEHIHTLNCVQSALGIFKYTSEVKPGIAKYHAGSKPYV